jgi:hypothetical protein
MTRPSTSSIQTIGLSATTSARRNSGEKWSLACQLRDRLPGKIGVLLVKDGQAHRVGDADHLISHGPQRFGNLQLVKFDHGNQPSARASRYGEGLSMS